MTEAIKLEIRFSRIKGKIIIRCPIIVGHIFVQGMQQKMKVELTRTAKDYVCLNKYFYIATECVFKERFIIYQ